MILALARGRYFISAASTPMTRNCSSIYLSLSPPTAWCLPSTPCRGLLCWGTGRLDKIPIGNRSAIIGLGLVVATSEQFSALALIWSRSWTTPLASLGGLIRDVDLGHLLAARHSLPKRPSRFTKLIRTPTSKWGAMHVKERAVLLAGTSGPNASLCPPLLWDGGGSCECVYCLGRRRVRRARQ
jgi:hypothetical protein